MRRNLWLIAALVLLGVWVWSQQPRDALPLPGSGPDSGQVLAPDVAPSTSPTPPSPASRGGDRHPAFLPVEAHAVLQQIERGGPYEYRQDGGVFQNREHRLPDQPRGYYREYTVETPGSRDRGARRIITGGQPPREYWYTDDHYGSFRRFDVDDRTAR
jgi:ribonuclease T1